MNPMGYEGSPDKRVARLIDANLDRAREGLRVVEDWCRFGLERDDLVIRLKDWRQRLGRLHKDFYKQARSTATDTTAGLEHPAQQDRHKPEQVVAANCGRVQEALRVLEEYGRSDDGALASAAASIRYGLYDLEVSCLNASAGCRRRDRLENCPLCLITSPANDLFARVNTALLSGVGMVQYRCKDADDRIRFREASSLRTLCHDNGALLIINDRIDLAMAVDADGVHLGQDDLPVDVARALIGNDKLIGLSTHNLDQVRNASEASCDYIGLGPVYRTDVKPGRDAIGPKLVGEALTMTHLPLFAIGGIDCDNIGLLSEVGCRHIAVINAIMAAQDVGSASRQLLNALSPQ